MVVADSTSALELVTVIGGAVSAVIGAIGAVVTLRHQARQRESEKRVNQARERVAEADRWEEVQVAAAEREVERQAAHQEARRRRETAEADYARAAESAPTKRRSYKAVASASLGVFALVGGSISLETATSEGELGEYAAGGTVYAILALVLGFLARRDIKSHPERQGRRLAWVGIVTGAVAALIFLGALSQETESSGGRGSSGQGQAARPDLTVALDCPGAVVRNHGDAPAGPSRLEAGDVVSRAIFAVPGLGPGQSHTVSLGIPGGPTSARIDPDDQISEENEANNEATAVC